MFKLRFTLTFLLIRSQFCEVGTFVLPLFSGKSEFKEVQWPREAVFHFWAEVRIWEVNKTELLPKGSYWVLTLVPNPATLKTALCALKSPVSDPELLFFSISLHSERRRHPNHRTQVKLASYGVPSWIQIFVFIEIECVYCHLVVLTATAGDQWAVKQIWQMMSHGKGYWEVATRHKARLEMLTCG